MRSFVLLLFIFCAVVTKAQYRGGSNDASGIAISVSSNKLVEIYHGGSVAAYNSTEASAQQSLVNIYHGAEGIAHSLFNSINSNTVPGIFKGGSNDVFTTCLSITQNALQSIYTGAGQDGVAMAAISNNNPFSSIYKGGMGKAVDLATMIAQHPLQNIYYGGSGKGWSSSIKPAYSYVFTGNGNWSDPANWEDYLVPPSALPAGSEIVINPSSGNCVLNIVQALLPGSKLTIMHGKQLLLPGNIQIN